MVMGLRIYDMELLAVSRLIAACGKVVIKEDGTIPVGAFTSIRAINFEDATRAKVDLKIDEEYRAHDDTDPKKEYQGRVTLEMASPLFSLLGIFPRSDAALD